MTAVSVILCCLCFVAFTEVAAWTIDLQEVRKFYELKKKQEEYYHHLNDDYNEEYDEQERGEGPRGQYAEEYGYETYMEKKVHGIARKGSKYLEGLRLAIENYKQTLENCSRANFTLFSNTTIFPGVRWNDTSPGILWNSSWVSGWDPALNSNPQLSQLLNLTASQLGFPTNPVGGDSTWLPGLEAPIRNLTDAEFDRVRCANATRERQHVRRLADLALYTTRQLQDRSTKQHHYGGHHRNDEEEKELLVRLAWFLDRLAHITGYEPNATRYVDDTEKTTSTTAAPVNPLALPVPEEVKRQMMECIRQNSSVPATVRCSFPLQLPPLLTMALNISENNSISSVDSSSQPSSAISGAPALPFTIPDTLTDLAPRELNLQASDLFETRLATDAKPKPSQFVKSIRKRSATEPILELTKYYMTNYHFNMNSDLSKQKSHQKRSYFGPSFLAGQPDESYRNVINYKEHNPRIVYNPDIKQADKLNKYLEKMRKGESLTVNKPVRNSKKSIHKRSTRYQDAVVARQSEDPQQDISYYVKNKPGTNYSPSLVAALEVRASLERIFQNGNIEVIRRYGANYNPLIPSPFYFGVIKTISDI